MKEMIKYKTTITKEAKVISEKYLYSPSEPAHEYLHFEEMKRKRYKVVNKKNVQQGKIVTYVKYVGLDD